MTKVVVIGGGIGGISAAAHLAPRAEVTLLEMESTLTYHTTGRSAALFVINYGAAGIRPLARASRRFLEAPPEELVDAPLLRDRGLLWIADQDQLSGLEEIAQEGVQSGADSEMLSTEQVMQLFPVAREDEIAGGLYEPTARDIDVAGLHQAFVRLARRHNTRIHKSSPVTRIERRARRWRVHTPEEAHDCDIVVNAAGAWGDVIAGMAGIEPVGLHPMRRTAFMVPGDPAYDSWPMVVDADQRFYIKPDGTQLLCSLAEENPSEPTDPRPRVEDVALAIERINESTHLGIRTVSSQWTGLRTFSPDREMVIGEEPTAPGFFWLVGQGGTGIQTAPAYGALLAALVTDDELDDELAEAGVDPDVTSPGRYRP